MTTRKPRSASHHRVQKDSTKQRGIHREHIIYMVGGGETRLVGVTDNKIKRRDELKGGGGAGGRG